MGASEETLLSLSASLTILETLSRLYLVRLSDGRGKVPRPRLVQTPFV
jgi:hypothetical protein